MAGTLPPGHSGHCLRQCDPHDDQRMSGGWCGEGLHPRMLKSWGCTAKAFIPLPLMAKLVFLAPEVGRDDKARWRKPRGYGTTHFPEPPAGATSARRLAIFGALQARKMSPIQGWVVTVRNANLGLTPQALRFHRFAVRIAGPRPRILVHFPAQQKAGAPTHRDDPFKINFSSHHLHRTHDVPISRTYRLTTVLVSRK
jgi:hypothetical protein